MCQRALYRVFACVFVAACLTTGPRVRGDDLARRGFMGVQLAPLNDHDRTRYSLEIASGIVVTGVIPGTAAEKAELEPGDVIVKIGENAIVDIRQGVGLLRKYRAGDTIRLGLVREGTPTSVDLTLLPRPKEASDAYEVIYDSAGPSGQRVRTLITKPKAEGKRPAVLIIQDLTVMPMEFGTPAPNPYRFLVEGLTAAGYVTMRAERYGVGDSEGVDPQQTRLQTDVQTFQSAIRKLKTYDFVDADNVFVFGYATGGTLAPMVSKATPVKGVVTYGAIATNWADYMLDMLKRRWALEMQSDEEMSINTDIITKLTKGCFVDKMQPLRVLEKHPDLREPLAPLLQGDEIIAGRHYRFHQELTAVDPLAAWKSLDANVLSLWGQSDFVASEKDGRSIADTVNGVHPGHATFVALAGIDSNLGKAEDAEESFLAGPSREFNPVIIETIDGWIKKLLEQSSS